jgi:A/G-specific adenine glycosylase
MNEKNEENYLEISKNILTWYDSNRRSLPWRARPGQASNPYHVLLSEIMLQQTIVATVIPYFLNFIKIWPTITDLAEADFNTISAQWAGLGYYRRAKNLHETAKIISSSYNGCIPNDMNILLTFPGIGVYTASAITAIAFNANSNVVDGNIERIFSRLYKIEKPLELSKDIIKNISGKHVPGNRNGDYAQALMDLGSSVCIAKTPRCNICPIIFSCQVGGSDEAALYPRRLTKKVKKTRFGLFFCLIDDEGSIMFTTNNNKGLFANMDVLPSKGWYEDEGRFVNSPLNVSEELSLFNLKWKILPNKITHVFSHFKLTCTIAYFQISKKRVTEHLLLEAPIRFVKKIDIKHLALPSLMDKIIKCLKDTYL